MPQWTDNQLDAINSRNGSVLISASAGSGKTAVLVERAIRLLTEGESPVQADRLLVVTFTRAAAAEMKLRIQRRLTELIRANPEDSFLRSQRRKLQTAQISTVHSFCSELIKDNSFMLDINRDFRIGETGELNVLKKNISEALVASMYERESNEDFLQLIEDYGNDKDDKNIAQLIVSLHEFTRAFAFPDEWMDRVADYYADFDSVFDTRAGQIILDYAKPYIERAYQSCQKCFDLMSTDSKLCKKIDRFDNEIRCIENMYLALKKHSWDRLACAYREITFPIFNIGKGADEYITSEVKQCHDIYKSAIQKTAPLFAQTEDEIRKEAQYFRPIVKVLFTMVKMFHTSLMAEKKEKNIYEYSDLEHFALKLLVKNENGSVVQTELAKKIASEFDEVMVDEYQDTNEIQETIFTAVSGQNGHLFTVGDVKQSIYSFRQAMPEIFIKRKKNYQPYDREADNYPASIILEKNFRSRREITDSVNFIFRNIMSEQCGDIDYDQSEFLVCGASYPPSKYHEKVSLTFLQYDAESDISKQETEVDHIAEQIVRIMGESTVTENGQEREPTLNDFAILDRNANTHSAAVVKRLRRYGLNATAETDEGFLDRREIVIILNFLRIIDNPVQDIPLLSVMMSPVYGFTPDELALFRISDRRENIYSLVVKAAENGNAKCAEFLRQLDTFRKYSAVHSVHRLINKIYEDISYEALLSGIYHSNDVPVNNALLFREYAKSYEANGSKGLSAFVNHINNIIETGGKSDLSVTASNSAAREPSIKVMTIHKSKGLEFPFVFLMGTSSRFHNEKRSYFMLDKELGLTMKINDYETLSIRQSLMYQAAALLNEKRQRAEEMRVLYVALTRAREELHIVCADKADVSKKFAKAALSVEENRISPLDVSEGSAYEDWLIPVALAHKDGEKLRVLSGKDVCIQHDCPNWSIEYIGDYKCSLLSDDTDIRAEVVETEESCDSIIDKIIKNRISFRYPHEELRKIPLKVSVSDLSHSHTKSSFSGILSRPDFASEKKMTAVERGTATHTALQHIDFARARENLTAELDRLADRGYITAAQRVAIDDRAIQKLISSDIVSEIIAAPVLYREFRFSVNIPAYEVVEDISPELRDRKVILQGAVDLAYLKDGGLVIIDYKTDRVKTAEELVPLYAKQLRMYKKAMEECTPFKILKCMIYSVRLAKFIDAE